MTIPPVTDAARSNRFLVGSQTELIKRLHSADADIVILPQELSLDLSNLRRAAVRNLPELLFEKLVNYRRMPFVKGVAE